jgi:predicted DNA-binding transcriptional regulator AlpA
MRMLTREDLKTEKGLVFSPQWISTLVRRGLFPKPTKLGPGSTGRNYWPEHEVDAWLEAKAAERYADRETEEA